MKSVTFFIFFYFFIIKLLIGGKFLGRKKDGAPQPLNFEPKIPLYRDSIQEHFDNSRTETQLNQWDFIKAEKDIIKTNIIFSSLTQSNAP